MATVAGRVGTARPPLAADLIEKTLAGASIVLLAFALAAVARGHAHWSEMPGLVWLHLVAACTALALTPIMFLRRRGDRLHRQLGWAWATAMLVTALISFGIRGLRHGSLSWIHILSVIVVVAVSWLIVAARRHDIARHRRTARALTLMGLLGAGVFTFPFGRLLGHWLFG